MFLPKRDDTNRDAKLDLAEVRRESTMDSARAEAARLRYLNNEMWAEQQAAAVTRKATRSKRR